MSAGLWVLLAAVVVALAFGGHRALTDGRLRRAGTGAPAGSAGPSVWEQVAAVRPDAVAGEQGTLLQFSSAFCAPCRTTRQVLADVARIVPGVTHVEVDAEQQLELVRALDVRRTPTTLVLDGRGREVARAAGVPSSPQVVAALAGTVS